MTTKVANEKYKEYEQLCFQVATITAVINHYDVKPSHLETLKQIRKDLTQRRENAFKTYRQYL